MGTDIAQRPNGFNPQKADYLANQCNATHTLGAGAQTSCSDVDEGQWSFLSTLLGRRTAGLAQVDTLVFSTNHHHVVSVGYAVFCYYEDNKAFFLELPAY